MQQAFVQQTRHSPIYIDDLVEGIYRAAFLKSSSSIFNLGSGVGCSVDDLVQAMTDVVKQPFTVNFTPREVFDVSKIFLEITRARAELDWQPATPMDVGIETTWDFVKGITG